MRKNKAAGIFAVITVALILQAGGAMAGDASCRADEYELMSRLIRDQYGSEFSLILIDRDTESWCLREPLGFLKEEWPSLKSETVDSLIVSYGAAPRRLEENFTLPVEYRLMSDGEYLEALHAGSRSSEGGTLAANVHAAGTGMEAYGAVMDAVEPDWDSFDAIFPDAQGYLILSGVAFDSECTQALVIFCNAYRCSGVRTKPQMREIAFFSHKDGAWTLVGVSRGVRAMD